MKPTVEATRRSIVCRSRKRLESGEDYLEIFDAAHSDTEGRFIGIGPIARGIIVVVYTEQEDDRIRIIGARFATKREHDLYRSHMDLNK